MVTRTPGAFPYFQELHPGVNGDTIRADSQDPALHADTMAALGSDLEGDAKQIPKQMSGDITEIVQKAPASVSADSRALAASGWYAVGLIRQYASCVDLFDTTVNDLNVTYNANVAADHTVPAREFKFALQPQYDGAVGLLDDGADIVAKAFANPGDPDNVRNLFASGMIPLSATVLWPDIKLTTNQITNAILSGDYPEDMRTLMTNAAASGMSADTTMKYYLKLNSLTPTELQTLLPENYLERGLVQPDGTTCGSSSLVVSKMLTHPDYAMKVLLGYDPATGTSYDAPTGTTDPALWRFEQDALAMHDKTNSGFLGIHWPKAWGTYPSDLTDEMNETSGRPGSKYHTITVGDVSLIGTDPDRVYDAMKYDVGNGDPVPIYVGNGVAPRHVVLATGTDDAGNLKIYDPTKGSTITVTRDQWKNNEGSDLGGNWDKRWIAVMPEQG